MIFVCLFCATSCEKNMTKPSHSETSSVASIQREPLPAKNALAYSGMLYYEYAEEANDYACLYVTYGCATVWNSVTAPNRENPTQSNEFDTAYTENIAPALYVAAVNAAVACDFENWDDSEHIYANINWNWRSRSSHSCSMRRRKT